MGWNTVETALARCCSDGLGADERYYFVPTPYAAQEWGFDDESSPIAAAKTNLGDSRVGRVVENGPLAATRFTRRSGDAGLALLSNWLPGLT